MIIPTKYYKTIDDLGRITIPFKLREAVGLEKGDTLQFFQYWDENGNLFLCVPCADSSIKNAKKLLEENGYVVEEKL